MKSVVLIVMISDSPGDRVLHLFNQKLTDRWISEPVYC